jgi:hypothetical protein
MKPKIFIVGFAVHVVGLFSHCIGVDSWEVLPLHTVAMPRPLQLQYSNVGVSECFVPYYVPFLKLIALLWFCTYSCCYVGIFRLTSSFSEGCWVCGPRVPRSKAKCPS